MKTTKSFSPVRRNNSSDDEFASKPKNHAKKDKGGRGYIQKELRDMMQFSHAAAKKSPTFEQIALHIEPPRHHKKRDQNKVSREDHLDSLIFGDIDGDCDMGEDCFD